MAELKDKIENALNEGRILILGGQVLLGAQFLTMFQGRFDQIPRSSQYITLGALVPLLIGLGLMMTPAAYDQIVNRGAETAEFHRFVTRLVWLALLPLAPVLGIDLYVAVEKVAGRPAGAVAGVIGTLVALFFWYGLEAIQRRQSPKENTQSHGNVAQNKRRAAPVDGNAQPPAHDSQEGKPEQGGTKLADRIKQVLMEARMVLPGVQALLGFQFSNIMTQAFDGLPPSSKYIHLVALCLLAFSVVLLITPSAYHRIVLEGQDTEQFHGFAGRLVVAAMVPLALALGADFYVVTRKITNSLPLALAGGMLLVVFFFSLWFGYTFYKRSRKIR